MRAHSEGEGDKEADESVISEEAGKTGKKEKTPRPEIPKVFVKQLPETYTQDDVSTLFGECQV
jgi:RNA recognition motif-containing protein